MKLSKLLLLFILLNCGLVQAQTADYTPPPLGSTLKLQRDDLLLEYGNINLLKTDFTDIDTCSEIAAIVAGETGTCGSVVLSISPALVTPNLGVPTALTLTNATGLPVAGLSDASANGRSLISASNYAAMRALLDLEAGTDFYSISAANAAFQPLDSDLTSIAALTTVAYGRALLAVVGEATLKALINAEAGVDFQAFDADLSTWAGLTPSANHQTLVTQTFAQMRASLDLEAGTDFYSIAAANAAFQPIDADLTLFAAGSFSDPNLDQFVWWDDSQGRLEFATIADLATEAAPAAGDFVTLYGAEGDVRKVNWSSLPGAGAGLSAADIDTCSEIAAIVSGETGTCGSLVLSVDPALTGNPTAPTASVGDADTSIATTAFVKTKIESHCFALSDETTDLTTGVKSTVRLPYAFTLTGIRGYVNDAAAGTLITVDLHESGTTIMATNKLTIDIAELTSTTAATAAGITDTAIADDAELKWEIDGVGTTAKGLKTCLIGYQT